jgi:multidrug efflux pump subunit AcrB
MVRPTIYGQAIIFLVFAPLLTFTGVEGKMFSPMAITVMLALAGRSSLSLTFVPAMVALLIRGEVAEKEVKAVALGQGSLRATARQGGSAALAVDRRGRRHLRAGGAGVPDAGPRVHPAA